MAAAPCSEPRADCSQRYEYQVCLLYSARTFMHTTAARRTQAMRMATIVVIAPILIASTS